MAERPLLGEVLLQAGVIDELQLSRALGEQHRWGGRLGLALLRLGFVEEAELLKALSRQLGVPAVRLGTKRVAPEALELVPAELAEKYRCLPLFLKRDGGREILHVAMEDPTDLAAIDDLSFRTGRRVRPVLMGPDELRRAMARFYGGSPSDPGEGTGFAETPLESGDTAPDVTGTPRAQPQAPDVASAAADAGATASAAAGPDAASADAAAQQSAAELSAGLSGADPESSLAPGFEPEEILAAAPELVAQGERNAKTQTGGVAVDVEDAPIATSVAPPPSEPELSAQEAEAALAAGALDVSVDLGHEGEDPLGVSGGDDDPATVLLEADAASPAPEAAEPAPGTSPDPPGSPGVSSASGASLAAEALREAQESVAAQANAPGGSPAEPAEPTIGPAASGDAGTSAADLPRDRGEAMLAAPAPADPISALADRGVRHDRTLPPPDLSAQAVLLPLELDEELPPASGGEDAPGSGSGSTPGALDEQDVAELAGVVPPHAAAPDREPDVAMELSDPLPDDDPVLGSDSDAADLAQPGPAEAALEVRVSDGPTHEPHVDVDHIGDVEPAGTAADPGDGASGCVSATSLVAPPDDASTDAEDWLTAPAAVSAADIGEQAAAAAAAASLGESGSGCVSAEPAASSSEEAVAAPSPPTPVAASVSDGEGEASASSAGPAPFSTRDVLRALTELLIEKQVLEPGELVARVRAVRAGATSAD